MSDEIKFTASGAAVPPRRPLGDWATKQSALRERLIEFIDNAKFSDLPEPGDVVVLHASGRLAFAKNYAAALHTLGIMDVVPGEIVSVLYPLALNNAATTSADPMPTVPPPVPPIHQHVDDRLFAVISTPGNDTDWYEALLREDAVPAPPEAEDDPDMPGLVENIAERFDDRCHLRQFGKTLIVSLIAAQLQSYCTEISIVPEPVVAVPVPR